MTKQLTITQVDSIVVVYIQLHKYYYCLTQRILFITIFDVENNHKNV